MYFDFILIFKKKKKNLIKFPQIYTYIYIYTNYMHPFLTLNIQNYIYYFKYRKQKYIYLTEIQRSILAYYDIFFL